MRRYSYLIPIMLTMIQLPSFAVETPNAPVSLTISPAGGVYGLFTRSLPNLGMHLGEPVPLSLEVKSTDGKSHHVRVMLTAVDAFGKKVDWHREVSVDTPADGKLVTLSTSFDAGMGYYEIRASFKNGNKIQHVSTEIGIIPPYHKGIRRDSFFASNTSNLRTGQELDFLQMIGMKVERSHFQPFVKSDDRDWVHRPSTGAALDLDFNGQDKAFQETKEHDTWVLPIAGYALQNYDGAAKSDMAFKLEMHGPPRNFQEFVSTWETILRHYPEVTTYEFWNEPWIFGWTWAATPEEYRTLQRMWCEMSLKVNPNYRLLAGNSSMFLTDQIEPDPSCWNGLLQGGTHHPYTGCGNMNMRTGDQGRSIDDGMQTTKRMGLPYYYLTEGGTLIEPHNRIENADKLVEYFVRAALTGCFQGNAQWDIGYGPDWTRSNAAFAVMTNFLEDRPVVADIWPEHELIWGAIFANLKQITPDVKALPRASELSCRWNVPIPSNRQSDVEKVAVIWGLTGESSAKLDANGTLTMPSADLKAFDMMGRVIPAVDDVIRVPLGTHPVYITSERLSVIELRDRISNGKIKRVQPLNMYALSLRKSADTPQTLYVRIENQLNEDVHGRLSLKIAGVDKKTSASFSAASGKLGVVEIPWPGVAVTPENRYAITLTASLNKPKGFARTSRTQAVSVARFVKRSIAVGWNSTKWVEHGLRCS